jgi:anti-sigma B factor antagonist
MPEAVSAGTWPPLLQVCDDEGLVLAQAWCAERPDEGAGGWLVQLCGELDAFTVGQLRGPLTTLTDGGEVLRVDLSEVTFMDSSGAGLLVALHRTNDAHGRHIEVVDPSPAVRRVIELSGIDTIVRVSDPTPPG